MSRNTNVKRTPIEAYRRLINNVLNIIKMKSNETISNATLLMPNMVFDFLKYFDSGKPGVNLKDEVKNIWEEKIQTVMYHTEEDMFRWFDASLKAPYIQQYFDIMLGHTSHEKPVILIHSAFDATHVYYLYQDEIKLELRYEGGTSHFMQDRLCNEPKVIVMIKEIIERYEDASILMSISGLRLNNPESEFTIEKKIIRGTNKLINEQQKNEVIMCTKLKEQLNVSCFAEFVDFLFYRFMHKLFRDYFPHREVMMNSYDKIPIYLNRTGILFENIDTKTTREYESKFCIIDDWDIVYIYYMDTNGRTNLIHMIKKEMMEFNYLLNEELNRMIRNKKVGDRFRGCMEMMIPYEIKTNILDNRLDYYRPLSSTS